MKALQGRTIWQGAVWLALFAAVAVLVFRVVVPEGALLFSTDDNVGLMSMFKRMSESSLASRWQDGVLAGLPDVGGLRPSFALLREVSAEWFTNAFHGLCLALGAWLLALWGRGKGLRPAACALGAAVAFWTGTNLTLTYAGHVGKYGVMFFCALALWATGKWGRSGKVAWGAVAGAAAGAMFLEQGDVALFCAVLLLPVGVLEAWRAVKAGTGGSARSPGAWAKQLLPAGLAAVLLAGGAALATRGSGVTDGVEAQAPEAKWEFITQWSQPPAESVDFIAPGWAGWRSGDPSGPYWGRTGRDGAWERTGRGFMNFRLETVYVGALPLFFAVVGIVAAARGRKREWLLWTGVTAAALVLSFGKYTPLYRVVAALPGFGEIRNPNKFLHFFQLGWGVLAAVGLDAAMRMDAKQRRRWSWAGWGMAAAAALAAGHEWAGGAAESVKLSAAGWGPMGAVIVRNKVFALWWCAGAFALAGAMVRGMGLESFPMIGKKVSNGWKNPVAQGGFFQWLEKKFPMVGKLFSNGWKVFLPWAGAALVVAEAAWLVGPHYIQTMPEGYVAGNPLSEHLQAERKGGRVALVSQDAPWYNQWLTYLFPHEGIPSLNVTQLPRPPADYAAWWRAVPDPVRQWQLAAVSHVLAHGSIAKRILEEPELGWKFRLDWAYRPVQDADGAWGAESIPAESAMAGLESMPEAVLALRKPVARVQPASYWLESEDAEALRLLAAPDFVPGETVLLPPGSAEAAGLGAARAAPSAKGRAAVEGEVELRPGVYKFAVEVAEAPALLRIAENFNAGWKCRIDGKAAPVLRADYLFMAVPLAEAGRHEVELRYAPGSAAVGLEAAGLALGLGAAAWLAVGAVRRKKDN
ncbi:MAG: hypothetical protein IKQ55_10320 [Kiritimatiellae bacterium]|nr:hypothetical protein [Kiritimatiellia bacterium]